MKTATISLKRASAIPCPCLRPAIRATTSPARKRPFAKPGPAEVQTEVVPLVDALAMLREDYDQIRERFRTVPRHASRSRLKMARRSSMWCAIRYTTRWPT